MKFHTNEPIKPPEPMPTPPPDPPRGWGTIVHGIGEPPTVPAAICLPAIEAPLLVRNLPHLIETYVQERGGLDDAVTYLQWEVQPDALELRIRMGRPPQP
jgi:hypothetical protein